jgi:hypothetical protein
VLFVSLVLIPLVIFGLMVILWAGTSILQGTLYTEPVADLYWRAPAAAAVLGLFLLLWCFLESASPGSYDTLFSFSPEETQRFDKFYSVKKGKKTLFQRRGKIAPFVNARGERWQRSDSQGVVEAVVIAVDGADVTFTPEMEGGKFKIEPGQSLRYREEGDGREITQEQLERGELTETHTGLLWLNFLFNFLHLGVWFACLWLLLRFQWPHALGLALACWLVMSIPGSIVSTLLAKAREAGKEPAAAVTNEGRTDQRVRMGSVGRPGGGTWGGSAGAGGRAFTPRATHSGQASNGPLFLTRKWSAASSTTSQRTQSPLISRFGGWA